MKRNKTRLVVLSGLVWGVFGLPAHAGARTVEEILKDKGYITEEEYKEVTADRKRTDEASGRFSVAYKPGKGFQIATPDDNNALTVGGRVQVRYTATDREESNDESTFRIRRARLWFEGHLVEPHFRYGFQGDFASGFSLRDAYLEFAHVPWAIVKVGQFKIPYNRQQITSSGALQFVDRPVTNDEFIFGDDGRDIGGMVYGELLPQVVTYHIGVFNGSGPNTTNEDTNMMAVGRMLFTPFGAFKDYYVEGDHVGGKTPRFGFGIGAAYTADETNGRTTRRTGLADPKRFPTFHGADIVGVTADAQLKWHGLALLGDYYFRSVDPRGRDIPQFDAHGAVAQVGYFILPQKLEVAARYAWLDPNDAVRNNRVQEYGGAVGYFFSSHNLKVQADLRRVDTRRPGKSEAHELEGRVQVQAIF